VDFITLMKWLLLFWASAFTFAFQNVTNARSWFSLLVLNVVLCFFNKSVINHIFNAISGKRGLSNAPEPTFPKHDFDQEST